MRTRLPAALLLSLVLAAPGCGRNAAPPPPVPPEVTVAEVKQQDVPVWAEAVGQTRGSQEVEILARVQGILESVDFVEGSYVRKGQLLYTIDPREYETTVDRAEGDLARAEADLVRLEQDVARYKPLAERNAIPRQQYETAIAQASAGRAAVEAARAVVARAKLDVGYTRVVAPTDGIVGKTEVNAGNLVGRGNATLLTSISKVDPIHCRFSLSERDYLRLARGRLESIDRRVAEGMTREAAIAALGDAEAPFELVLADGSVHPHKGKLAFVDRLVDPTTGTLLMEVAFPNPDKLIRPGQYGRVRAAADVLKGAILVPQKSVSELQGLRSVFVLAEGNKVEMRPVKVGPRVGGLWAIEEGLAPTDRVVVDGIQKIAPGVEVRPTVVPIEG